MSETPNLMEGLFVLFVVIPTLVMMLFAEITLIVTAAYRFTKWVERKWWS